REEKKINCIGLSKGIHNIYTLSFRELLVRYLQFSIVNI
ncbi:MAG: hypothetical protein ACI8VW_003347, partial [bacterium]